MAKFSGVPHWNGKQILESDCREPWHTSYVIDVKDKRNPKVVGLFPRPAAPPDAPYADF